MIKKVLLSMLVISLLLVGCKDKASLKQMVDEDTQKSQEELTNATAKPESEVSIDNTEPSNTDQSASQIKELKDTIAEKDKLIESLNTEIEKLKDDQDEVKNTEDTKSNVTTTKNNVPKTSTTTKTVTKKYYRIVVGTFDSKTNATTQKDALSAKNIDSYIAAGGGKFRVVAGTFGEQKNAAVRKELVDKAGFDCFVVYE